MPDYLQIELTAEDRELIGEYAKEIGFDSPWRAARHLMREGGLVWKRRNAYYGQVPCNGNTSLSICCVNACAVCKERSWR